MKNLLMKLSKINVPDVKALPVDKSLDRRRFLKFGMGIMAGLGIISTVGGMSRVLDKKKTNKVKMLTEDGRLVEIDLGNIEKVVTDRASNEDVQHWMKNKSK